MFDFSTMTAQDVVLVVSPFLSVIATYLIAQESWSKPVKAAVAFIISALFAALVAYSQGSLVDNFWDNFLVVYTIAQGIYWSVFKGVGLEKYLPKQPVEASEKQPLDN